MGNSSSSSSPFSSTSFPVVSGELGSEVVNKLEADFRVLAKTGGLSEQAFTQAAKNKLGPAPQAATRLFSFLAGSKTNELTFERWLVGVYLFDEACSGPSTGRQTQLLFSVFDSKQNGYIERTDLSDLLLVAVLAGESPYPASIAGGGALPSHDVFASELSSRRGAGGSDGWLVSAISLKESTAVMQPDRVQQPMADFMCDLMLRKCDTDRDGRLNATEWARFVEFEPAVPAFASRLARFVAEPLRNLRALQLRRGPDFEEAHPLGS